MICSGIKVFINISFSFLSVHVSLYEKKKKKKLYFSFFLLKQFEKKKKKKFLAFSLVK
jgi:hypothetical protein